MKTISVEPNSLILSGKDVLYVLNRRGIFTIKAKNIDRLHDLLKNHINGKHDEATLLSSVSSNAQKRMIKNYLAKLYEAGALRSIENDELSQEQVEAGSQRTGSKESRTSALWIVRGQSVFVSLSRRLHPPPGHYDACLFFITRGQVKDALLSFERWRRRAKRIVYVIAGTTQSQVMELERRKEYASWFLRTFSIFPEQPVCVQLYELDEVEERLVKLLEVNGAKRTDLRSLPEQLNVVTVADLDQVPLIVARASHPFFVQDISMIGLRYDTLHEELMLEFCARVMLIEVSNREGMQFHVEAFGEGQKGETVRRVVLNPRSVSAVSAWHVAASRLHLRFRLLEHYAAQTTLDSLKTQSVDLMEEETSHPDVLYLRRVLRLRTRNLPARLLTTEGNLFIYECNGCRSCSLIRAKALRDILLIISWETFYSDASAQINKFALQSDFRKFINDSELRTIMEQGEAKLFRQYGDAHLIYRQIGCWGRTAWVGQIKGGSLQESYG